MAESEHRDSPEHLTRRLADELQRENERLREAIASALTSLGTGPMKDGYAYAVLSDAVAEPVVPEGETPKAEQIKSIPSHRSDELPRYIQIDRLNFRVDAVTLTGSELRRIPTPPVSDEYDLWKVGVGGPDELVQPADVIDLRGGRFFSVPKIINAGSSVIPEGGEREDTDVYWLRGNRRQLGEDENQ